MSRSYTIFITQPIHPAGIEILKSISNNIIINERGRPLTKEEIKEAIKEVDAIIVPWATDIIDRDIIYSARKLKVIGNVGIGYDNIDIKAATERGIYVTYTAVHRETVADLAFALMLCVARKIYLSCKFVKEGKWTIAGDFIPQKFMGQEVHGKTLGIIGMGGIGYYIAKRAKGFNMEILYHDIIRREDIEKELGVKKVSLESLLRNSDFISINCPLTPTTKYMIGKKEFDMMKRNAILINTARGPIIDTNALYEALKEGKIAGAGLDVTDPEPLPPNHPLLNMDNVVIVPHIGSATEEARMKMAISVAEDVKRVLNNQLPLNLLNTDVLKVHHLI